MSLKVAALLSLQALPTYKLGIGALVGIGRTYTLTVGVSMSLMVVALLSLQALPRISWGRGSNWDREYHTFTVGIDHVVDGSNIVVVTCTSHKQIKGRAVVGIRHVPTHSQFALTISLMVAALLSLQALPTYKLRAGRGLGLGEPTHSQLALTMSLMVAALLSLQALPMYKLRARRGWDRWTHAFTIGIDHVVDGSCVVVITGTSYV